jgi:hypothetical protein
VLTAADDESSGAAPSAQQRIGKESGMLARLFRGSNSHTVRTKSFAEAISERHGQVCRYLTDGVHLYRFMGSMVSRAGEMVGIENCWSLDIMLIPPRSCAAGTCVR